MRLRYAFETLEMDGATVAVPLDEHVTAFHGVIRLNETAAFLFDRLKEETTEEALVDALEAEYDAPRSRLAEDVRSCLARFRERGLLAE